MLKYCDSDRHEASVMTGWNNGRKLAEIRRHLIAGRLGYEGKQEDFSSACRRQRNYRWPERIPQERKNKEAQMAFSNGTFNWAYVVVWLPSPSLHKSLSAQLPIVSVRLEACEERAMWLTPHHHHHHPSSRSQPLTRPWAEAAAADTRRSAPTENEWSSWGNTCDPPAHSSDEKEKRLWNSWNLFFVFNVFWRLCWICTNSWRGNWR